MTTPIIRMDRLILGNWKMNLTQQAALALAKRIAGEIPWPDTAGYQVGICPPFPYLLPVADALQGAPLLLGAQDCHEKPDGAFTGNVSAAMLLDVGCSFVLIGHSERRQMQNESDSLVRAKALHAISSGLHAVLCVGETQKQRESGKWSDVLTQQLLASLPENASRETLSIAYEPVWAIGSGRTATLAEISQAHAHIRDVVAGLMVEETPRILYGGSVKANNALEILSLPVVDGVLVGGASIDPSQFAGIIQAAAGAATMRV